MEELTLEEEQQYFADAMGDMLGIYGAASDYSTKAPVRRGQKGPTVQEAQKLLLTIYGASSLGSLGADGDFGGKTETLVKQFQGEQGLAPTGTVDSATWAKLYEATGQGAAPKTKNEKAKDTINTIFDILKKNVLPLIGPKQTESPTASYVPSPTAPSVPPAPEKGFPWGMAIGGIVVAVVVVGGLVVVMKKKG